MLKNDLLSRRNFLGAAVMAGGFSLIGRPSFALTEASARQLVDSLVAEINRVIASGKSESAMIRDFERIFVRYADVPIMARYALGVDGRRASPDFRPCHGS